MNLVELPMLLAPSDSDEDTDDYKEILRRNGVPTGEDDEEETQEFLNAWINLDHLTAFYPATDSGEQTILELMGTEIVVAVTPAVILSLLDSPELTNTTS